MALSMPSYLKVHFQHPLTKKLLHRQSPCHLFSTTRQHRHTSSKVYSETIPTKEYHTREETPQIPHKTAITNLRHLKQTAQHTPHHITNQTIMEVLSSQNFMDIQSIINIVWTIVYSKNFIDGNVIESALAAIEPFFMQQSAAMDAEKNADMLILPVFDALTRLKMPPRDDNNNSSSSSSSSSSSIIVATIHSNTKRKHYHRLVDILIEHHLPPTIHHLQAHQLTNILSSLQRIKQRPKEILELIKQRMVFLHRQCCQDTTPIRCVAASTSRIRINTPPLIKSLSLKNICIFLNVSSSLDFMLPSGECLDSLIAACIAYHRAIPPSTISGFIYALVRHNSANSSILSTFATQILLPFTLPRCRMRELSDISRAYAKILLLESSSSVLHENKKKQKKQNPMPESNALVSSIYYADKLFDAIAARAADCVGTASLQDITRVVSAFHQLEMEPEALLDVVEEWSDRRLASLPPRALGLSLVHFARLGSATPRLLKTAAKCVEAKVNILQGEDLARIVWAFARLEYHPGSLVLSRAVHALEASPAMYSDRIVANMLWALARLEHQHVDHRVLQNISKGLTSVAATAAYSGQSAALIVWSIATLYLAQPRKYQDQNSHYQQRVQLQSLSVDDNADGNKTKESASMERTEIKKIVPRRSSVNRSISNPLDPSILLLVEQMVDGVVRDMPTLDPQSISLTAWSIGSLGMQHDGFVKAVTMCCKDSERLAAFEPQNIANLVWGLAKITKTFDESTLIEIAQVSYPALGRFAPQELFNLCWGFATFRCHPRSLSAAAAAELFARGSEFSPLEFSGMLWALGCLLSLSSSSSSIKSESGAFSSAFDCVWKVADRELPSKAELMNHTQVCMALNGLGKLSSSPCSLPPFPSSSSTLLSLPAPNNKEPSDTSSQAIDALLKAFLRCISDGTLSSASFAASLEGFSRLGLRGKHQQGKQQQGVVSEINTSTYPSPSSSSLGKWEGDGSMPTAILDAINVYALQQGAFLPPWEYSSISFYLTELNLLDTAQALLKQHPKTKLGSIPKPRAAVLLLAAMQRCDIYPEALLTPVVRCLHHLPMTYSFDRSLNAVLRETVHALNGKKEKDRVLSLRMKQRWG